VRTTTCFHLFHAICLDEWLRRHQVPTLFYLRTVQSVEHHSIRKHWRRLWKSSHSRIAIQYTERLCRLIFKTRLGQFRNKSMSQPAAITLTLVANTSTASEPIHCIVFWFGIVVVICNGNRTAQHLSMWFEWGWTSNSLPLSRWTKWLTFPNSSKPPLKRRLTRRSNLPQRIHRVVPRAPNVHSDLVNQNDRVD
jgi:hypothetical protein